jgi:hypothetical protein
MGFHFSLFLVLIQKSSPFFEVLDARPVVEEMLGLLFIALFSSLKMVEHFKHI